MTLASAPRRRALGAPLRLGQREGLVLPIYRGDGVVRAGGVPDLGHRERPAGQPLHGAGCGGEVQVRRAAGVRRVVMHVADESVTERGGWCRPRLRPWPSAGGVARLARGENWNKLWDDCQRILACARAPVRAPRSSFDFQLCVARLGVHPRLKPEIHRVDP